MSVNVAEFIWFRRSELYQDIKVKCGLPITSNLPNDNWSLTRGLFQREMGLASRGFMGNFSVGQQKSILNSYLPTKWSKTLHRFHREGNSIENINLCRFDEHGKKLLIASTSDIYIYDVKFDSYQYSKSFHRSEEKRNITGADISANGELVTTYDELKNTIYITQTEDTCKETRFDLWDYHSGQYNTPIYFMPCDKRIICSNKPNSFFVFDIETLRVQYNLISKDKKSLFWTCAYPLKILNKQDPNVIVSGDSRKGYVNIYDLRSYPEPVKTITCHNHGILCIDAHSSGNYILTNARDSNLRIWDIRQPIRPQSIINWENLMVTFHGSGLFFKRQETKFSPLESTGQRYIYAGSIGQKILIYDLLRGKRKEIVAAEDPEPIYAIHSVDWHPTKNEIVSGSHYNVNVNVYQEDENNNQALRSLQNARLYNIQQRDKALWSNSKSRDFL